MSPVRIVTTALTLTVLTSGSIAQAQFGRSSVFRKLFERSTPSSNTANRLPPASPSSGTPTLALQPGENQANNETGEAADPIQASSKLSVFGADFVFTSEGVVVAELEMGGDSLRAGLQKGDRLQSISGLEIDQLDVLTAMQEVVSYGEELPLEILRENGAGEPEQLSVLLVVTQGISISNPSLQVPSTPENSGQVESATPELDSILSQTVPQTPVTAEPIKDSASIDVPPPASLNADDLSTLPAVQLAERVLTLEEQIRHQQATIERQAAQIRELTR